MPQAPAMPRRIGAVPIRVMDKKPVPKGLEQYTPQKIEKALSYLTPREKNGLNIRLHNDRRVLTNGRTNKRVGKMTIAYYEYKTKTMSLFPRPAGGIDEISHKYGADSEITTILHETGHHVQHKMSDKDWLDWMEMSYNQKKHPTKYAKTNPTEDFAESFAIIKFFPQKRAREILGPVRYALLQRQLSRPQWRNG